MTPIRNATPEATVHSWWTAWERKDRQALERLAREEYMEFTGHSHGHRVGRGTLLELADETFRMFTITEWKLDGLQQLRPSAGTTVVGYRWHLRAQRGDGELRVRGVATDVLIKEEDGWSYLSHHSTPMGEVAG